MEVLFLLIGLSVALVCGVLGVFLWAVRSGQFDDMEGPAWRILSDEDELPTTGPGRTRAQEERPQCPK